MGGLVIYLDLIWRIAGLGAPVIAVDVRHVGMRIRWALILSNSINFNANLCAEGSCCQACVSHIAQPLLFERNPVNNLLLLTPPHHHLPPADPHPTPIPPPSYSPRIPCVDEMTSPAPRHP